MSPPHKGNGSQKPNADKGIIKFPCDFMVKVMGENTPSFEALVKNIFNQHFDNITEANIVKRPSKDSHYLALTITVHAENKAQLDALYQALSNEAEILMAL